MDTFNIVLIVALGILLGCLVVWLLLRKRHITSLVTKDDEIDRNNISLNPNTQASVRDLEDQIVQLKKDLSDKSVELKRLQEKEGAFQSKLEEKNKELSQFKTDLEKLISSSGELNENEVISLLKKDLSLKSKQLEDKEEEIEDLEDEVSSVKKKMNKLKMEFEETSIQLEKKSKEIEAIQFALKTTEFERDELKDDVNIKAEAIEFVNAILKAKDADDRDAIEYAAKVQKVKDIVFDQYIQLKNKYFKDENGFEDKIKEVRKNINRWCNLQQKTWLKNKKVIAFIGEFSAGKTSIVNRILSQDDPNCPKLPVSSKATTAIATYISYGAIFLSQFTDQNGNLKQIEKSMFERVNKDILSQVNVGSIIRHFVIKYNNENLKGLSILDTPGFSSSDKEDQNRTLDVINEADALFWVMDANSGEINRTSLQIIKDNIDNLPLYVIINKADTKSSGELDKLEKHICQTMNREEIKVQGYLRFSKEADSEVLMDVVKRLPKIRIGFDIVDICLDLQRAINESSSIIDSLKYKLKRCQENMDELNERLDDKLESQKCAVSQIVEIPQRRSHWFRADDYRIDQDEYEDLSKLCKFVDKNGDDMIMDFDNIKDCQKEGIELNTKLTNEKEKKSEIYGVLKRLLDAIKILDGNLHREIEQKINQEKYDFVKRGYKQDSYNLTRSNQIQTKSTDNLEQGSQSAEIQDWMAKANQLMHNGAKEEAMFWLKKAAKAGNKDAQQFCSQNATEEIETKKEQMNSDKRENKQDSYNLTRSNQIQTKSTDSLESGTQLAEIQDWMVKANQLMHNGAKEEAKFWFKKAAKAGNKDAQRFCIKNGLKY